MALRGQPLSQGPTAPIPRTWHQNSPRPAEWKRPEHLTAMFVCPSIGLVAADTDCRDGMEAGLAPAFAIGQMHSDIRNLPIPSSCSAPTMKIHCRRHGKLVSCRKPRMARSHLCFLTWTEVVHRRDGPSQASPGRSQSNGAACEALQTDEPTPDTSFSE